jgi:hypothetical protein
MKRVRFAFSTLLIYLQLIEVKDLILYVFLDLFM